MNGLLFLGRWLPPPALYNLTSHFWGIYEMGFPEGSNVEAKIIQIHELERIFITT
jgi:hypothetical protein